MIGFAFAANAQSCDVGNGSYVSIKTRIGTRADGSSQGKIIVEAYCYGDNCPKSGMVYATVYYYDKEGNRKKEEIPIQWTSGPSWNGFLTKAVGRKSDVSEIDTSTVTSGACRW